MQSWPPEAPLPASSFSARCLRRRAARSLQGTRRLFLLIQGEHEGRQAAARVARALAQQGPARMSDVLGSLVARTLRDRLALLSSLDVTARLQVGSRWRGVGPPTGSPDRSRCGWAACC